MATDEKKKGPLPSKAVVDTSILDPKRIEELRAKAKDTVGKERKVAAEAQLLEQFKLEERQAGGLEEEIEEIFIDLAPYADRLMLDGVVYFNGRTVRVRKGQADVMREMIQATWRHQSVVDGKPEDFYRKSRAQRVIPLGNGQAGVSNILRA